MKPGELNKLQLLHTLQRIFGHNNVLTEHRFAKPLRQWRFDYAVPVAMLAVEYHGHSGFVGGKVSGHSTIKGLTGDCEKMNHATSLGWTVLAFTALHFRESERRKHNLTDPEQSIMRTLSAIQDRIERVKCAEGNDFMKPENTDTQLKADCVSRLVHRLHLHGI